MNAKRTKPTKTTTRDGSQCHTKPDAPAGALCSECGQPDPFATLPEPDLSTLPEIAVPDIPDLPLLEICRECGLLVHPSETGRKPKRATTGET